MIYVLAYKQRVKIGYRGKKNTQQTLVNETQFHLSSTPQVRVNKNKMNLLKNRVN